MNEVPTSPLSERDKAVLGLVLQRLENSAFYKNHPSLADEIAAAIVHIVDQSLIHTRSKNDGWVQILAKWKGENFIKETKDEWKRQHNIPPQASARAIRSSAKDVWKTVVGGFNSIKEAQKFWELASKTGTLRPGRILHTHTDGPRRSGGLFGRGRNRR